jgi:hypothetical protein
MCILPSIFCLWTGSNVLPLLCGIHMCCTMPKDRSLCLQYFFSDAASCKTCLFFFFKKCTSSAPDSNSSMHSSSHRLTADTISVQIQARMAHGALLTSHAGEANSACRLLALSDRRFEATHQISSVAVATIRYIGATRAFVVLLRRHTTVFVITTGLVSQKNSAVTSCRCTVYQDVWGV